MKTFQQPLSTEQEAQYIQLLHADDPVQAARAREILIEKNLRLVAHIAKKYQNVDENMEDLISIGTIGLIKAIESFDAGKGKLSTYASRCIDNEFLMLLRSKKKNSREVSLFEPIGVDKEGNLIAGFYAGRTHQIIPVPNRDCVLGVPENKVILDQILDYMREEKISAYDEERHKGLVRHVLVRYGFTTKEIMVCLIINGDKLPSSEKLLEKLTKIPGMTSITYNINKEKTNVIMGSKVCPLWGQTYITDYIGNVKYQISPLSFYQVNPVQTEVLYGTALEYAGLTGKETVWDVYCGIGTISLFLAQKAQKVYGVEIVPKAIEDAKHNAEINEITNAEFFVGKAEEVLPEYYADYAKEHPGEHARADVIVVDPPRKGCERSVLDTMVQMEPERFVYVSCDSATLARDV